LSIFALIFWAIRILFRKSLPVTISWSIFTIFSSSSFKDSGLNVFSPFWVDFYTGQNRDLVWAFYMWVSISPSIICWRGWFFLPNMILTPCRKSGGNHVGLFLGPLFHCSMCLFGGQYHAIFCYDASVV
jgi:hypothetical protein